MVRLEENNLQRLPLPRGMARQVTTRTQPNCQPPPDPHVPCELPGATLRPLDSERGPDVTFRVACVRRDPTSSELGAQLGRVQRGFG